MSHLPSLSDPKVGLAYKDSFLLGYSLIISRHTKHVQDSNLCRPLICTLHPFHYYFAFSFKYLVDRPRSDEELRVVLPLMFDLPPTAVREYRKLRNKHAVWRSAIARQSLALWMCATEQSSSLAPVTASRKIKKTTPTLVRLCSWPAGAWPGRPVGVVYRCSVKIVSLYFWC